MESSLRSDFTPLEPLGSSGSSCCDSIMWVHSPRQIAGIFGLVTLASLASIYVCVQRIHIDWHVESGKLTFEEDRMALLLQVSFNTHHGVDVPTCNCKIRCPSFRYDVDLVERNMTATRGICLFAATEVPDFLSSFSFSFFARIGGMTPKKIWKALNAIRQDQ